MTNAEKLAKDTDLMATMVRLYCSVQHDCTECALAENQCCVLNKHVDVVDFLKSEVREDD